MDPQTVFCPNSGCPARGQQGQGNIGVHSHQEHRYVCPVCHPTFAETKGTVFYRLQTDPNEVTRVVTLLAYGCPLQAIVVAFGLDERTVKAWLTRAGEHAEQVHEQLVQRPRELGLVSPFVVLRGWLAGLTSHRSNTVSAKPCPCVAADVRLCARGTGCASRRWSSNMPRGMSSA